MLDYSKSFIETQFPVSKISKESYKERKANLGQTLTGLGKWWGRKPLILVRATLLGVLMPASDNPLKDKEIFLKILTMDEEGLYLRKFKNLSVKEVYDVLNSVERKKYFDETSTDDKPKYVGGLSSDEKEYLQKLAFNRLSYDDKLTYCLRPENVKLENKEVWDEINEHLEISAYSIEELTQQLGQKRFGRTPKVGDCFAGGGSIPFESARMGADVYASDLNPVASVLTWASLNIAGASEDELEILKKFQDEVYQAVDKQICDMGIEINEFGHRADSYIYCNEAICPECGYKVPLAPSWIIGKGTKTIALLSDNGVDGFDIDIIMGATATQYNLCEKLSTIKGSNMFCPHCKKTTPIGSLRGDNNKSDSSSTSSLRLWKKNEFTEKEADVFKERLYAVRYVDDKSRYYRKPSETEIKQEDHIRELIEKNIEEWQLNNFMSSDKIECGYNTNQPIRERGWQYWHQLFNPRQILYLVMILKKINEIAVNKSEIVVGILGLNKILDWNSKLCIWHAGAGVETNSNTFTTQSLNTLYNYGVRGFSKLDKLWYVGANTEQILTQNEIEAIDARDLSAMSDIWLTDPPYADAVNYHELTEYFLSWNKALISKAFPNWYTDTKRVLAVKGVGHSFNNSMIEIYSNLAQNMSKMGYQVVMFTHQDVKVWSELAMILWSSGLHVVSAWNIATETESGGLKNGGNYVKGTVLLTLKKQTTNETAFQDELYDEIKTEVKNIIDSMRNLDDKDDPDFTDADYLLASYASSLKVLTKYKEIEGIDVPYWLAQPRDSKEENPVEALINKAVRIAYDYLIPEGFEKGHWADLKPEERFFIRGLEIEMNGSNKISSYQELARGFGVSEYQDMFASFKANQARLKTPSEYRMTQVGSDGFGKTLLRHLLVALNETVSSQSTEPGRAFLRDAYKEDNQYWFKKPLMIEMLNFISKLEFVSNMEHWHEHAKYARILKESLKNEGV